MKGVSILSKERLTKRTKEGIWAKEDYEENALKTLYQCYGVELLPHYANCDEGYCAIEKLAKYEDLEERLEKMFGGKLPLEKYVDELELALKEPNSPHPMNARILTYAESAKRDEYCRLEEQGLLLRLPISSGSEVYLINSRYTKCTKHSEEYSAYSCQGCEDMCDSHKEYYIHKNKSVHLEWIVNNLDEIGKTVFLTQSEAEEKLRELEGK